MNTDYFDLLTLIADRLEKLLSVESLEHYGRQSFIMDLDSVEQDESIEMDWDKLINFDNSNFLHDTCGIIRHMDRTSFPGKLTDCFLPRCAK